MFRIISFKSLRKALSLSASFLLLFSACKKEEISNTAFAENTIAFSFTDTLRVESSTVQGDSILADKISTGLVGIYKDSVFGKSIAQIHVQPLLPSNSLVFGQPGENLVVDSIVLSLEYNGFYGDKTKSQTIDVFRIDEQLESSTSYYSNTQVQTIASPLATKSFVPNTDSSVQILQPNQVGGIDTVKLNPQLRIPLDISLASEILSKSGQAEVSDNDNFTAFFKGLKIAAQDPGNLGNNENAILYFALTSTNTKMTIYYKTESNSDTIPRSVDFPINSSSVRFTTFQHDYTGTPVETALQNTSFDAQHSYTIAMAGVESVIKFPTIKSFFKDDDKIINRAELIIPAASGSYANSGIANTVIIASRNENNQLQFIPDFFEGSSYFGGQYDASTNSYTFNIGRYLQGLINGTENEKGLTLLITGSAVKAERLVLQGADNPNGKIRLHLYYSNTQ